MKTKLCDREDYVEDQEIKLENKEEQLNQRLRKHWKENEIRAREKTGWKSTKTVSYLTGPDGQRATINERARDCGEEAIAETASASR